MTTEPQADGELVVHNPDARAARLACSLGGRRVRRNGVRYFIPARKAEQFSALYAAGFWPINRKGAVVYTRDPRPLALYDALEAARQKPLDSAWPEPNHSTA